MGPPQEARVIAEAKSVIRDYLSRHLPGGAGKQGDGGTKPLG